MAFRDSGQDALFDRLVKVDLDDGTSRVRNQEACYPGEPVFIAAPDGDAEDDGVVLSVVLDGGSNQSFLLVLDAKTFEESGRAINVPRVPFGFHGNFYGVGRQEQ